MRVGAEKICFVLLGMFCVWTESSNLSIKKCQEYGEYVMNEEYSPILRLGAGTNKVSECGIVETTLIVGGTKAKIKEFPHQAVIGYGTPPDKFNIGKYPVSWECGGSIISEIWILTAAHCMETRNRLPAIRVRAGTVIMSTPDPSVQERVVVERIRHPEYMFPAKYHDLALFKLDKPWDINGYVRPACLETNADIPGKKAIATGFGVTTFDDGKTSDSLMKVSLSYFTKEQCERVFKYDIGTRQMPKGIVPGWLCAGTPEGGKDTCQGDSGGPLQRVLQTPYCMYSIVGVVSFGKFCGFPGTPAIYTRVSYYVDWIESVIWPGEN